MNLLVTGGAGYIGSVVVEYLAQHGHRVAALDNLRQGHREAVAPEAAFIHGDVGDPPVLEQALRQQQVEAVLHLAAESLVGPSMTDPQPYFATNVARGLALLDTMRRCGVQRILFASSAAVYGNPEDSPIHEDTPPRPVNPYGESKLVFERILHWYGQAYGLQHLAFRFFNVAGATPRCGEHHEPESHLVPLVLRAASRGGGSIAVFGTDYPTPDGTCLRDYVHVLDVAEALRLALEKLEAVKGKTYNLGSGQGASVLQVIEAARRVTGTAIPAEVRARRPGDPPSLVPSIAGAARDLGWRPQHSSLEEIVESAWRWQQAHPRGYGAEG